jgi:GNAT superfamily N-acetyltransferase
MDKKIESITTISTMNLDRLFYERIYHILIEEFDKAELRNYESQMRAFEHSEYYISFLGSDVNEGFALWWNFSDFIFIEYLWVILEKRRYGIGSQLLDELKRFNKLIILEIVEGSDSINFYFHEGFRMNSVHYQAMDLSSLPAMNYFILSYNRELLKEEYDMFINKIREDEYQF